MVAYYQNSTYQKQVKNKKMKRILLLMICFSQILITQAGSSQKSNYNTSLKLNKIVLPSNLSSIGVRAFYNCVDLNSFTIPAKVVSIGREAFGNCSGLQWLYSNTLNPVDLSNSAEVFTGVDKTNCKLNVPEGTLSLYKKAKQWEDFFEIGETFINADVKVTYENGELVFRSYGNVVGVKVDLTETRQLLGNPEIINQDINSVINITENTFTIEISSIVTSGTGSVIIKIPCTSAAPSDLIVEIIINGREKRALVDPSTENKTIENNTFSIYPNPANQTLFIQGLSSNSKVAVFDLSGKKIISKNEFADIIDVSQLNAGLYVVRIEYENKIEMKKFLKQ
jgi:hypothetical protein